MALDADQRRAVEVRHNVVVAAGAGSGKTRVLTERYMAILRNGEAGVPEILALTFTRKAAAEMFGRIYRSLTEEVQADPALQRELDRFDEARISTIDSFCAGILRDGAARFGLPAVVQSDDRQLMREARRQALGFVLSKGEDPGMAAYIRQYGVDGTVDNLLLPLITEHIRLSREGTFREDFEVQQEWLARRTDDIETEVDRIVDHVQGLSPGSPSGVAGRDGCVARRGRYAELYEFLMGLRKSFGTKGDSAELKDALNLLLEKRSGRNRGLLAEWEEIRRTRERTPELEHLFELFDELGTTVRAERRASGLVGHQEVMELAVRLLREDAELRRLYADQFRFIMIDEFQDNNETQRDLLFLLADPGHGSTSIDSGKLFFVGDQKQSIYRFRGADVAVFRRLATDIAGSLPPENRQDARIDLPTNYRSAPELIDFFNKLFPVVFGEATEPYEAEFAPLEAGADTPKRSDQSTGDAVGHAVGHDAGHPPDSPVTIAWVPAKKDLIAENVDGDEGTEESGVVDGTYAEGGWIADEIDRLISGRDDAPGTYRPGDIAILLRSSAGQQMYERMLRRKGIPYQTQAVRSLFTEAPANDLYALLQLQFYPTDREALVTYLRSPLVMLSDSALVRVVRRTDGAELFDPLPELAAEDAAKLRQAARLYQNVGNRLDRVPLTEVVRSIWDEGGYRYALLHRSSDHAYLEHYDYLFSLALRFADRPAVEFVDFLREQMGDTEKLDELDSVPPGNAVQLMTIHKSKGLQFPVVFVADCDRQLQQRGELIWNNSELGVTVRLPARRPGETTTNVIETHSRDEEQRRTEAELKRLLYVAATRVEERLYFTAALRSRSAGLSFFRLLRDALPLDTDRRPADRRPAGGLSAGAVFGTSVSLAEIPPMTEQELRSVAVPQGARRRRIDAQALYKNSTSRPLRTRRVDMSPTFLNQVWADAESAQAAEVGAAGAGEAVGAGEAGRAEAATGDAAELTQGSLTLGSLTHHLLELRLNQADHDTTGPIDIDRWNPDHPDLRHMLRNVDDHEERLHLCRESWELAEGFFNSSIYREVVRGAHVVKLHTELPFLLRWGEPTRFFNGKMDLVVEAADSVDVVDFKTDHLQNPETYGPQMAVYRTAAAQLFGKPVTVHLYYLRFNESVIVDTDLDEILSSPVLPPGWDDGEQPGP